MGGHGGLNILPQKSWNVYNRDNRLRVERDEARAAAEAAAAARQADGERAAAGLQTLRARAGAGPAAPQEHVNLFFVEERAQGNFDHQQEQKAEDARLVARVMPDLQLDRSSREPAPWYTRVSAPSVPDPGPAAQEAAGTTAAATTADHGRISQKKEHKRHKEHKEHKRHKEHKERKHRKSHKHRDGHKRKRDDDDDRDDEAAMERLRQERRDRERTEQLRARSVVAYGKPEEEAAGGAAGDRKQQHVVDAFMAATGQVVSLKPLKPRGSRGGRDAGGAPGKKEQAGAGCAGAGATRPHSVH